MPAPGGGGRTCSGSTLPADRGVGAPRLHWLAAIFLLLVATLRAGSLTVATYNIEN